MLVSCVCARVRAHACAFASVHVHVNLGLIIKALLQADAQTGWQTSRQANTEHSSAGVFLIFLLWPDIPSPSSRQLILIHNLFAATFFAFQNMQIFGSARSACDGSSKSSCEY